MRPTYSAGIAFATAAVLVSVTGSTYAFGADTRPLTRQAVAATHAKTRPLAQQAVAATHAKKPTWRRIATLFDRWNAALASGDAHRVADLYAADAVLLPTFSPHIRAGRAEITEYFKHFLKSKPVARIQERYIDVLSPTSAVDTGLYQFTLTNEDGSKTRVNARYTFVYKRRAGSWLIINHHSSALPTGG